MWYWYVERPTEIFVDIDSRVDRQGGAVKARLAQRRLKGAVHGGKLAVKGAWLRASAQPGHYHLLVQLSRPLPAVERVLWAQRFLDDPYRSLMNGMRVQHGIVGSLLITPSPYVDFRGPDYLCECDGKHSRNVMRECPVGILIRGPWAVDADYYGVPSDDSLIRFGRIL